MRHSLLSEIWDARREGETGAVMGIDMNGVLRVSQQAAKKEHYLCFETVCDDFSIIAVNNKRDISWII